MFALQLKLTKLFDTAGVKMLAGSDFGGVWVIPGVSLHQEFDLLGQAGLSPLRVLQMTTLDGAEFFGLQASAGAVEEGKNANLVVLDGNPIESIQNLHKIDAVVRGRKVLLQGCAGGAETEGCVTVGVARRSGQAGRSRLPLS